ncbi:MAG: thioredoxin family protein [Proteobacteria bacterium SW_6_67_9]|nr:MAG: thioredoxin family protein [Proteobacteria bacterium SW_6_67_9]
MAKTPSTMVELGTPAPDFRLPEPATEREVARSEFEGQPLLVAFLCNHCPFVLHINNVFAAFAHEYQERGLAVVAINANDVRTYPDDHPDKMAQMVRASGFMFPYLFDETQEVARAYGAACTPDFFLYDSDHRLVYRGRFDAATPGNDEPVTGEDLRAAADAVLEETPMPADQKPSMGCNIKWKPGNEPAYAG